MACSKCQGVDADHQPHRRSEYRQKKSSNNWIFGYKMKSGAQSQCPARYCLSSG